MLLPSTQRNNRWRLALSFVFLLFLHTVSLAQPQTDDSALFREGEILLAKGDTEKALWRFKRLLIEFPKSSLLNEAKFRMGICYTQLKKPQDAIRILNELISTFLSPPRMFQVFSLLGDNYFELKDRVTALHWYGKGLLLPNQPNEELKKKLKSVLDASDTEEELKSVESLYRGAYAGGYAKLRLAQLAKRQGNDIQARRYLAELEKEYRSMDYMVQAKELYETLSPSARSKYTVGVILPLSGVHRPFGERALQGIQCAIKETDFASISLAIRDSKGSPLEAERAVEELVNKERAIAIIGPLLSSDVDRAVRKAQQLKVPLLTFSQKELPAGKGDFVFQDSLTPFEQIQALTDYSTKELNLRTFAVFYPNSPYGLYFKNLFQQEITRKSGKLSGTVVYQEDQTDFTQEIKEFFKVQAAHKYDSIKKKDEEFKASVPIQAIFIPDAHDRVGTILSQLAYYDIKGLVFLGNSAWNGPGLIAIGGKGAEGSIFVDAFFKKDRSPSVTRFVDEFRKAYQRGPETLEALTYDGAKFIREILVSKSVSSPLQLQEEIRQVKDFQGVSGLSGFGEDGKAIRTYSVLTVKNGQIEKISP